MKGYFCRGRFELEFSRCSGQSCEIGQMQQAPRQQYLPQRSVQDDPLKVPNLLSYYHLAELISANWAVLKAKTWTERFSASRPHLMNKSSRAVVPRYSRRELPRLRALRYRNSRYLLHTDINQFYPTLYTHTIPWAIHSKASCKAALTTSTKGKHLLGSQILKGHYKTGHTGSLQKRPW